MATVVQAAMLDSRMPDIVSTKKEVQSHHEQRQTYKTQAVESSPINMSSTKWHCKRKHNPLTPLETGTNHSHVWESVPVFSGFQMSRKEKVPR